MPCFVSGLIARNMVDYVASHQEQYVCFVLLLDDDDRLLVGNRWRSRLLGRYFPDGTVRVEQFGTHPCVTSCDEAQNLM